MKSYIRSTLQLWRFWKKQVFLLKTRTPWNCLSEGIQVVDLYTGKHRTPIKSDLVNVSRVVDFLSDVDICEKTRTGLIPALASANLIYGLGILESGITFGFG
tara:strand:- start:482 stop:787 length:306 start_codon:yes stop_codon:yes gene_type:complete